MKLTVKVEKIVTGNGELCYKVIKIDGLTSNSLPELYTDDTPKVYRCYSNVNYFWIRTKEQEIEIYEGNIISINKFEEIKSILKECAIRLKTINQTLAQLRKNWNGEEIFEV